MTSSCHVTFLLSLQNLSLSINTLFLLLSMTKKSHIIQRCRNKLYNELLFITAKVIIFMVKQKRPNLKHNTLLQNNTLQNNQQLLLTNSTMSVHHELFVISLTNLIHIKRFLHILHLQHSQTFSKVMIKLSKNYNLWTLTPNDLLNHQKQYKQHLKI